MSILAVDYGSSFTQAALRTGEEIRLLAIGGSAESPYRLPRVVWLDEEGALLVGWAAERGSALAPERLERSPKQLLGDEDPMQLGRAVTAEEAVAAVLLQVVTEARRLAESTELEEVRLTHPASWPNKRKAALREAARQAGLEKVALIEEPVAAARHLAAASVAVGESVAVYDLGGGTFDTAVLLRSSGGEFETIGVGGRDYLGGETFDARLSHHLSELLKEVSPSDWDAIVGSPRAISVFRREVRAAKEALSVQGAHDLVLPEVCERASLRIARAEFEHLIEPQVRESVEVLAETIAAAGLQPKALKAIYVAGGSSRIPLVGRVMEERFGRPPNETQEDPKSVVALGAAGGAAPAAGRLAPEDPPRAVPPVVDRAPRILGEPREGAVLRLDAGRWIPEPEDFRYQWLRCDASGEGCSELPAATDRELTLTVAEVGSTLRVRLEAWSSGGASRWTSATSGVVARRPGADPGPGGRARRGAATKVVAGLAVALIALAVVFLVTGGGGSRTAAEATARTMAARAGLSPPVEAECVQRGADWLCALTQPGKPSYCKASVEVPSSGAEGRVAASAPIRCE